MSALVGLPKVASSVESQSSAVEQGRRGRVDVRREASVVVGARRRARASTGSGVLPIAPSGVLFSEGVVAGTSWLHWVRRLNHAEQEGLDRRPSQATALAVKADPAGEAYVPHCKGNENPSTTVINCSAVEVERAQHPSGARPAATLPRPALSRRAGPSVTVSRQLVGLSVECRGGFCPGTSFHVLGNRARSLRMYRSVRNAMWGRGAMPASSPPANRTWRVTPSGSANATHTSPISLSQSVEVRYDAVEVVVKATSRSDHSSAGCSTRACEPTTRTVLMSRSTPRPADQPPLQRFQRPEHGATGNRFLTR